MNAPQLSAIRSLLAALQIEPDRQARIIAACRDGATAADTLIKTREAAAILGIHAKTLFRYRRRGMLHSVHRSPRCIRWRKSEVETLANGGVT